MITPERAAVVIVLVALMVGRDAVAAPAEMIARFEQGRALVKEGQYEQAIPKFLESLAVEPSVGALLNLGDCYERLGKPASARRRFLEAAELAGEADATRAAEARARAAKLTEAVGRILVVRRGRSEGGDARVTIDGEPLAARTERVEVDPGAHEVVVTFPDGSPDKRNVAVRMGQAVEVVVEPPVKPRAMKVIAPETPAPSDEDPGHTQRWLGIGTGAVGVIALGVGATFGVIAIGKQSDLDAACPGYPRCPEAQRAAVQPTYDDTKRYSTLSTIGFIGGGVLLAAGVVMWLTAPEKKNTASLLGPRAGSTLRMELAF